METLQRPLPSSLSANDAAARREFERLVVRDFTARMNGRNPDINLADVLKMLDAYCELKKHDLAAEKIAIEHAVESEPPARAEHAAERQPSAAAQARGYDHEKLKAALRDGVREIYGVHLRPDFGIESLSHLPDRRPSDRMPGPSDCDPYGEPDDAVTPDGT